MSERTAIDREPVDVHTWFSLTYANYLVLPRSVLQSMPDDWQHAFTALLDEAYDRYGHLDWPDYAVQARGDDGRFMADPIPHYNRGRTYIEPFGGSDDNPHESDGTTPEACAYCGDVWPCAGADHA